MDAAEAALKLANDLRALRVSGVVTVGVRHFSGEHPELLVYVERVTPLIKQTVGTTYEGFSAKVVKSGKVRPASR
jgi:hypothetical protein